MKGLVIFAAFVSTIGIVHADCPCTGSEILTVTISEHDSTDCSGPVTSLATTTVDATGADFGASNVTCTDTFFDELIGCTCDAAVTTLSNMGGLPTLGCTPAFRGNETHNATGPSSLVGCVGKGAGHVCPAFEGCPSCDSDSTTNKVVNDGNGPSNCPCTGSKTLTVTISEHNSVDCSGPATTLANTTIDAKGADFGVSDATCTDTFFDDLTVCTCDAAVTTLRNIGGLPALGCTPAFGGNETHNATGPSSLVQCAAKGHRLDCPAPIPFICQSCDTTTTISTTATTISTTSKVVINDGNNPSAASAATRSTASLGTFMLSILVCFHARL